MPIIPVETAKISKVLAGKDSKVTKKLAQTAMNNIENLTKKERKALPKALDADVLIKRETKQNAKMSLASNDSRSTIIDDPCWAMAYA